MTTPNRLDPQAVRALHDACRQATGQAQVEAFETLGQLLYRMAWRRVQADPRLHDLAADCMQEALVVVWRRLQSGEGPDDPDRFIGWSATILINKLREAIRRLEAAPGIRRSKRIGLSQQVSLDVPAPDGGPLLAETLADPVPGAEAELEYAELQALVGEIHSLPEVSEASRVVLLRGYLSGWTDAELASHLHTTVANVQVVRSRDLGKLRRSPDFMARLRDLFGA